MQDWPNGARRRDWTCHLVNRSVKVQSRVSFLKQTADLFKKRKSLIFADLRAGKSKTLPTHCNTEEERFCVFGGFFSGWKRDRNPAFNPGFILLSEIRAKTSGVLCWDVIKNSSLNKDGFTKQILLLLICRLLQVCAPPSAVLQLCGTTSLLLRLRRSSSRPTPSSNRPILYIEAGREDRDITTSYVVYINLLVLTRSCFYSNNSAKRNQLVSSIFHNVKCNWKWIKKQISADQ